VLLLTVVAVQVDGLSRVTRLHCLNVGSQWRLTAFGCQNGYVVAAVVDVISKGTRLITNIHIPCKICS